MPGTKREQQAAIFKRDRRPTEWQEQFSIKDEESLKKVTVFQWSNKFETVLTFFFRFIVECFSKHPQTRHDILNTTTLRFFYNKSRDFAYLCDFVTNFGYAVTQVLLT